MGMSPILKHGIVERTLNVFVLMLFFCRFVIYIIFTFIYLLLDSFLIVYGLGMFLSTGTNLVGTQLRIEEGSHVARHSSPNVKFSGYLYGTADRESYSFQIGTRMALINQVPINTMTGV